MGSRRGCEGTVKRLDGRVRGGVSFFDAFLVHSDRETRQTPKMFFRLARTVFQLAASLTLVAAGSISAADAPFEFKDGDRVLFIGDTFFEREVDYGQIETRLTSAFPSRAITFRNLAWAGDTPMGRARASFDWNKSEMEWLQRVKEQIALVKPTVAFLSYGLTQALEQNRQGITPAEKSAEAEKFRVNLGKLMDAVQTVGAAGAAPSVRFVLLAPVATPPQRGLDLSTTVKSIQQVAQNRGVRFLNPGALELELKDNLLLRRTRDGLQLNEAGYHFYAETIVESLKGENVPAKKVLELSQLTSAPMRLLAATVRHKNELFFHRWRPANWTYLFGFRKNEQGKNSVEIPKFDPLVTEWDARIEKLRDLDHQDSSTAKEVEDFLAAEARARRAEPRAHQPQAVPTFEVAEGFEATLWAENPSLHKPIQMNWDPQGRLWIASSELYPMIQPGQPATDTVVVLEDTDGDGHADKHTIFADGLVVPTGVLPDGRGGCYVAASHQLLHFADTNGDGVADQRTIVLSSFGTEDTHHNLHTLRWGYDGHIYFNQSIYTHTHIETPFGVRRLNSAGIWRFNPDTYALEVFTKGGCNPWGHHWDQFGNSFFTDGAGGKGIYHAMEGATYFTYSDMRREADSISPGNYPKFASLELIHSPAFPAEWQGTAVTCDFRAHRVVRFGMSEVGSSFQTKELPDLLRSTNLTFRPIDLRTGPDGALYIADWSNPIIQHGEVDFRDPRRDKEHGRIWRVAAKGTPTVSPGGRVNLVKKSLPDLLDLTLSSNSWAQEQARVVLRQRGPDQVLPAVKPWLARQTDPRAKLEAMWLYEAFERPSDALLGELASAADPRLRTAAARQLSR